MSASPQLRVLIIILMIMAAYTFLLYVRLLDIQNNKYYYRNDLSVQIVYTSTCRHDLSINIHRCQFNFCRNMQQHASCKCACAPNTIRNISLAN